MFSLFYMATFRDLQFLELRCTMWRGLGAKTVRDFASEPYLPHKFVLFFLPLTRLKDSLQYLHLWQLAIDNWVFSQCYQSIHRAVAETAQGTQVTQTSPRNSISQICLSHPLQWTPWLVTLISVNSLPNNNRWLAMLQTRWTMFINVFTDPF